MNKYYESIRTIRKSLGMTQVEMAEAMGIQRSTFGRFERGETSLLSPNGRKFLRATGKELEDLLYPDSSVRYGLLRQASTDERVDELTEEIRSLRTIVEMLAARVERLCK